MIGAKVTLASLYFGCFIVIYNLYHLNELYGLTATFLMVLLLSSNQIEREEHLKGLEDEIIQSRYWGKL